MRYILSGVMIALILIGGYVAYQRSSAIDTARRACDTQMQKEKGLGFGLVQQSNYAFSTGVVAINGMFTIGDTSTDTPYTCTVIFASDGTPRAVATFAAP